MQDKADLVELTANIVAAYLSNNSVAVSDVPALIETVFNGLANVEAARTGQNQPSVEPAVPVKQSVTDDYLICLEDGKRFKSLKRHYAAASSKLAKKMGLGQKTGSDTASK